MRDKNTITLNGQISTDIEGLLIQELPPISKPAIRTQVEEIDGRDGDITTLLGYSAYNKEITIGLYGDFDINQVIAYFNSEGTVTFSNEPDKFYYYQINEQIDFERLVRYRVATVTFHVQPFKYAAFEGDLILDPPATNLMTIPDWTQTTNGVTLTATDGTVSITGTPTAATEFYLPITALALDAGTYTLSATSSGTNPSNCSIRLIGSSPSNADSFGGDYIALAEGTVTLQGSLAAAKTFNYLWFYISTGKTLNFTATFTVEDQAEKVASGEGSSLVLLNTTEAPFNKFDLKGESYQQSYKGYQLLQKKGLATPTSDSSFWNAVTNCTIQDLGDGWARFTSTNSTSSKQFFIKPSGFTWVPSTTYTIILEIKNAPSVGGVTLCQPQNAGDPFASTSVGGQVSYSFEGTDHIVVFSAVTKSETTSFGLRPFLYAAFAEGNTVDMRLTIVAGNHVSDYQNYIYEPYVGGIPVPNPEYPQDVGVATGEQTVTVTGKNLIGYESPFINAYFEGAGSTITSSSGNRVYYIPCRPNTTYTITTPAISTGTIFGGGCRVGVTNEAPAVGVTVPKILKNGDNMSRPYTYTTSSENAYFVIRIQAQSGSDLNLEQTSKAFFDECQIEFGSTATDYQPYQSQSYAITLGTTELCKIGEYQDYFYKDGDDWYIHKEITKLNIDGSESWSVANTGTANFYYNANIATNAHPTTSGGSTSLLLMSNYGAPDNIGNNNTNTGIYILTTNGQVRIRYGTEMSVANWKTKLATNNMLLYYVLATPTNTKITDETLIGQLEAIRNNVHAYNEVTFISSLPGGTTALPPNISVEVAKSSDGVVTNDGNFPAKPKLTIYGSGDIGISLNGNQIFQIALGSEGYITIDTAAMEAYQDSTENLKNRLVTGDYDNFYLNPGENQISFSGIVTKCIVENYSRWL